MFVDRDQLIELPCPVGWITVFSLMPFPGQVFDCAGIDISWVSPPHHVASAVEDEAHIVPVAEAVGLHVTVGVSDVQSSGGQTPGMVVVFAHALGQAFEVRFFMRKRGLSHRIEE